MFVEDEDIIRDIFFAQQVRTNNDTMYMHALVLS